MVKPQYINHVFISPKFTNTEWLMKTVADFRVKHPPVAHMEMTTRGSTMIPGRTSSGYKPPVGYLKCVVVHPG